MRQIVRASTQSRELVFESIERIDLYEVRSKQDCRLVSLPFECANRFKHIQEVNSFICCDSLEELEQILWKKRLRRASVRVTKNFETDKITEFFVKHSDLFRKFEFLELVFDKSPYFNIVLNRDYTMINSTELNSSYRDTVQRLFQSIDSCYPIVQLETFPNVLLEINTYNQIPHLEGIIIECPRAFNLFNRSNMVGNFLQVLYFTNITSCALRLKTLSRLNLAEIYVFFSTIVRFFGHDFTEPNFKPFHVEIPLNNVQTLEWLQRIFPNLTGIQLFVERDERLLEFLPVLPPNLKSLDIFAMSWINGTILEKFKDKAEKVSVIQITDSM